MEHDEVTSTDLLNSMSQCLMAVKPERKVVETDDRVFSLKVGGKPPRSMFYRFFLFFFLSLIDCI
jgi:hypothetical protein